MNASRLHVATEHGVAVPLLSLAEMREVLRIATDHVGPGLLPLIENGGRTAALTALDMLGRADARVIVLVGEGTHGAFGVCAARHFANRGVGVEVVTITHPSQSDGPLGQQFLALAETPARVTRWDEAFVAAEADLLVDAIQDETPDGPPRGAHMALARAANHAAEAGIPVLALAVPSGVDPETGAAPGIAVRAARTLALGLPLRGLHSGVTDDLWLADLGIPPGVYARAGIVVSPWFGLADRIRLRFAG